MAGEKKLTTRRGARASNQVGNMKLKTEKGDNLKKNRKLIKSFVSGAGTKNPIKRGAISAGIQRREGSNATAYGYDFNLDSGTFALVSVKGDKRRKPSFTPPTPKILEASKPREWMNGVKGNAEGNSRGRLYVCQCDTHPASIRYATSRSYGIKGLRCTLEGRTLTETLSVDKHGKVASIRQGWAAAVMSRGVNKGKPAETVSLKGWCKACHQEANKAFDDDMGMTL